MIARALSLIISMCCWVLLSATAAQAEPLRVFAASSLANPLTEIADAYEVEHHQAVTLVFASSSILARQISEGAPADVFVSANQAWMDYLEASADVDASSRHDLTSNRLVIALIDEAGTASTVTPANLIRFLDGRRFGMCDPAHVPCGIYAKQALQSVGLWDIIEPHLALAPDARALMAWLDRGELGAAILYASDLSQWAAETQVMPLTGADYGPIRYEIAPVGQADPLTNAMSFTSYVIENAEVFVRHGFTPLPALFEATP